LLKARGFSLRRSIFEHCSKESDILYFMLHVILVWIACMYLFWYAPITILLCGYPGDSWRRLARLGCQRFYRVHRYWRGRDYYDLYDYNCKSVLFALKYRGFHSIGIPCMKHLRCLVLFAFLYAEGCFLHPSFLSANNAKKLKFQELLGARNNPEEAYLATYTHCEIHPSLILGVCASIIPFPDHNQVTHPLTKCMHCIFFYACLIRFFDYSHLVILISLLWESKLWESMLQTIN
jgi:hypothetical protein